MRRFGHLRCRPAYWLLAICLIGITLFMRSLFISYHCEGCGKNPMNLEPLPHTFIASANRFGHDLQNISVSKIVSRYNSSRLWQYPINCSNIHQVSLGKSLGHGVSKVTYAGWFHGKPVAVKFVTPDVDDIKTCVSKLPGKKNYKEKDSDNKDCYTFPNMKIMKEILMVSQLDHPGIIKLLGYCIRSEETVLNPDLNHHGVIAIYEKAEPLKYKKLSALPLDTTIRMSIRLLELFDFLEHSPLGSLVVSDLKLGNLMLADDGRIKISDLDDVNSAVGACGSWRKCLYGIACVQGRCVGENAAVNMVKATEVYFSVVLKCSTCSQRTELRALVQDMSRGIVKANDAIVRLKAIQAKM